MFAYNRNYGGASIYVDLRHINNTINTMKSAMSRTNFEKMMSRTFNDAGRKVKTIIRTEVPKDYMVKPNWVGSMVGWPKSQDGGKIGVIVPIKGARGSIGKTFGATGGAFTRKGYTYSRKGKTINVKKARINKRIKAKILKNQASILPYSMKHQGGQPPFIAGGVVFTRKYANEPYPIVHVVGLSVPQMPLNKSKERVQKEIRDVVEKRLAHHFKYLLGK